MSCNRHACETFQWVYTPYGACSAQCGGGSQSRHAVCASSSGYIALPSKCSGAPTALSRTCNLDACPAFYWKPTAWSACSASCGTTGVRTRTRTPLPPCNKQRRRHGGQRSTRATARTTWLHSARACLTVRATARRLRLVPGRQARPTPSSQNNARRDTRTRRVKLCLGREPLRDAVRVPESCVWSAADSRPTTHGRAPNTDVVQRTPTVVVVWTLRRSTQRHSRCAV